MGDFLCVNHEQHREYKSFNTEGEMRTHWVECHRIAPEEEFLMLVVPDSGKEPPMVVNMPMLDIPGVSGEQVNPHKAKGAGNGIGKGTGKDTGNRKARGRASKLPPSCFSAITKLAVTEGILHLISFKSLVLQLTANQINFFIFLQKLKTKKVKKGLMMMKKT